MSRSTHKWYPTSGTHEVSKCSRNSFYWQIQQVVPYKKILLSKNYFIQSGIIPTSSIISTHDINHTRWWFHKWSSTLSDHQMKNVSLNYKSSSVSNGWPMLSHRGRCTTNWYQDQISYVWYLKKPYTRYKWYKLQVVSSSGVIPIIKRCP